MHYIYKITNTLNGKVYIGQSNSKRRWSQHQYFAKNPEQTKQYIHRAMAKYGVENFIFEEIASCLTQEDTDETESLLIKQYDSRNKNYGYNLAPGGNGVGSGSDNPNFGKKQSQGTIDKRVQKLIGKKRTEEQKANLSKVLKALDKTVIYTPEVRQNMSEAHLGIKDTEETKQKKSESAKEAWEKRIDYSRHCEAPGCQASGKIKYKIIDGVRYCNMHGLRMLRYGRLSVLSD